MTGDWETLLKADAEALPVLLTNRVTLLAKRGRVADVAQAGAKLRELEPKTSGNLYKAACAYGLANAAPTDSDTQRFLVHGHNWLAHVWTQKQENQKVIEQLQLGMDISDRELAINQRFMSAYNQACLRSLRVLLHKLKHPEPDEAQQAKRKRLADEAINRLKAVIDADPDNFDFAHMKRDPDRPTGHHSAGGGSRRTFVVRRDRL